MKFNDNTFKYAAGDLLERYQVRIGEISVTTRDLIEHFERHGIEVYLCGGTVRDIILGEAPNDIDLIAKADISFIRNVAEAVFGGDAITIYNDALGLVRIGDDQSYIDINMFRDIASVTGVSSLAEVRWGYSGSPVSDALTTDFTVNAMYWREGAGLIDPLGGFAHCESRTLVISASQHKASIDPKLALRMARFASIGYTPDANALAFFQKRIDDDVCRYGDVLPAYLHELTRGSHASKRGLITFAQAHGANPSTIALLQDAIQASDIDLTPYAAKNSASPLTF